jgi:hypothetical protein
VTETLSEAENFSIGTISYGLPPLMVKIEKLFYQDPLVFHWFSRKLPITNHSHLRFLMLPVGRAAKTVPVVKFSE